MHSCTHELAGLGPAPGPLQPVYRLATQGCAHYEHGANCYSAAAPMLLDNPGGKVNDLLDCGDAGLNKGGKSLFDAVLKGYNLQGAN